MGQEGSVPTFDESIEPAKLARRDLLAVAEFIKSGQCKNVVFMVGAGISTAAGIPDFRSPETGLYSNLARLELPRPEAVFDISYFRHDPRPFYSLAKEMWPGKFRPTLTHLFMRMFADRGLLLRVFTQNIDTLELAAGIPRDKIVFAHGSFAGQHCIECRAEFDRKLLEEYVARADPAVCECGGLVKPDITFFGEPLPAEFHDSLDLIDEADLAIVMGSSLSVYPFASLPQRVHSWVPRLLLNMEKVGEVGSRRDDVVWLGECDDGVRELAEELGWWDEMIEMWKELRGDVDESVPKLSEDTLEDEVNKLTGEVERSLKVAEEHKEWVVKGLEKTAPAPAGVQTTDGEVASVPKPALVVVEGEKEQPKKEVVVVTVKSEATVEPVVVAAAQTKEA